MHFEAQCVLEINGEVCAEKMAKEIEMRVCQMVPSRECLLYLAL